MFSPTYFVSVLTVTLGASTQFYSYGVVNPEQELLTKWINDTYMRRNGVGMNKTELNVYWSFVVSSIAVGAIFGSLLTRSMAERFGRKGALILNGWVNVVGALLELLAKYVGSPEFLIAGRLLLGGCMGLTSGLVPMYLMEITPAQFRGAAGTFHQVAVAFSDWFSLLLGMPEVLGSEELWPLAFSFPGLLALALCCILPFCPESPKHTLITLSRRDIAGRDIRRLVSSEREARHMLHAIIKESAFSLDGIGTYGEIFSRRELRIPLLVSVLVMVGQQFTGCSTIFAYSTDMFLNARLDPMTARFSTLAVGIVYFLFACTAPFLIERLGRRALLIFQLGFVTVALALLSTFTWLQRFTTSIWTSYATIGAFIFYMCAYGVGSPIPWMITSEIFPTKYRSAAVTIAVFVAWSLAFVISTVYLPFQQVVGISASFLPFVVVSGISTVAIYFFLPETRNKHAAEIVEEIRFRAHSVSTGHPFRSLTENVNDEKMRLLDGVGGSHIRHGALSDGDADMEAIAEADDGSSEHSYYRYVSIAA